MATKSREQQEERESSILNQWHCRLFGHKWNNWDPDTGWYCSRCGVHIIHE